MHCHAHRLAVLALALLGAVAAAAQDVWVASEIRTTLYLYPSVLGDLGIEVRELQTSAAAVTQHPLSVTGPGALAFEATTPWSLQFLTTNGRFDGFVSGTVRHGGGFELAWRGGAVSLRGFELRPGAAPRSLEIAGRDGSVILEGTHLHWDVDPELGLLRVFNVDLRLSQAMAERLGRPKLRGKAVGVLTLTATVKLPPTIGPAGGPPPCGDWSGEQDVALLDIGFVDQLARSNGEVVMVPSARLKNVGTANVPWYSKFSGVFPPYNNDQHPFLEWSAFRIAGGVIHQLGVSDLKHAFLTINSNCDAGACTDSHILGLGCEDVYGTGTNSSNNSLAWREEVFAASGIWAHCDEPQAGTPSHFDQNGDCVQDFFGSGENAFTHGLVVQESDLADTSAEYFFSSWYLVRDDIDIFNTMGYRQIDPELQGSTWTFSFLSPLVLGSPVDAWVPAAGTEPGQQNELLDTGEGHLQLAVRVTDLGDGFHRYEYALMNHDFDRKIEGLSIPLQAGLSLRNAGFRDIDQDPVNDWQATTGSSSISWQTPDSANALPWGVLFNFSFEADSPATSSTATLDVLELGLPDTLQVSTLAPAPSEIFADGFESGDTSAWSGGTVP